MKRLPVVALGAIVGCGGGAAGVGGGAGWRPAAEPSRFISCVESFEPGPGAGFGQDHFPDVIYGPPHGAGTYAGSTDVLSLGARGSIIVGFGGGEIVDGDGPDLLVFENAFRIK